MEMYLKLERFHKHSLHTCLPHHGLFCWYRADILDANIHFTSKKVPPHEQFIEEGNDEITTAIHICIYLIYSKFVVYIIQADKIVA